MNKLIEDKLIKDIGLHRYNHSLRVAEVAVALAKNYKANTNKARIAGIFHDCGKILDDTNLLKRVSDFDIILDDSIEHNHELIHGPLGAKIAEREYNIKDREILDAIYYHTIGRENMTVLDKIIYIADYIEPKRNFKGIDEVRQMAYIDLDKSVQIIMENTISFLIHNGKIIHTETVKARNYLIMHKGFKNKINL